MTIPHFWQAADDFTNKLWHELNKLLPAFKNYAVDHFCYKCQSVEEYDALKELAEKNAAILLSEVMLGGRPIASFKLTRNLAIQLPHCSVDVFELAAPKPGDTRGARFDHLEVVIGGDMSFETFIKQHPLPLELHWDLSDSTKVINPDISLKLSHGIVKFHHSPLEEIIELEQRGNL